MSSEILSSEISTLYVLATLVATMLGGLLLHFARREKIAALNWWGAAYVLGAAAIAVWAAFGSLLGETLSDILAAVGIGACGLIWTAARVFHGRRPVPLVIAGGIAVWLIVLIFPDQLSPHRLTIAAAIVAVYVGLSADQLWSERRKALQRGWPALAMPVLHAAVLLLPILIGDIIGSSPSSGNTIWATIFAIELVLYAVGTVFVILMLVSERTVRLHKVAASTDPLTGLFNRRGFAEATACMIAHEAKGGAPVSLLVFDLDHFKSINDRFGHPAGDEILKLFASTVTTTLRTTDISGRLGGEEFAALLPCSAVEATTAAERVREAFANSGIIIDDVPVDTTVSIGIASGPVGTGFDALLAIADAALYRAKRAGRNRIEVATAATLADAPQADAADAGRSKPAVVRRRSAVNEQPV